MTSKVDIANIALAAMLGTSSIQSFSEESKEARTVSLRFDSARDTVLASHPWNFAKARAKIAADTETPAFDWARQFSLPADFLRVVYVEGWRDLGLRYEIEGRKLLSDIEAPLHLVYVQRVTDYNKWDALAIEAFAAFLASEIAMPLMQDRQLRNDMVQLYKDKVSMARGKDAMDEPTDEFIADTWTRARLGQVTDNLGTFRPISRS
jgi:hypothetical protein